MLDAIYGQQIICDKENASRLVLSLVEVRAMIVTYYLLIH